jgi:cellulose synthase (UDP-forming)
MAHFGGIAAIAALVLYLTWRVAFTLPSGGWNLGIAWTLVIFEALPLGGLVLKAATLWNIDCPAPDPVRTAPNRMRVAVLIPTYNEPARSREGREHELRIGPHGGPGRSRGSQH